MIQPYTEDFGRVAAEQLEAYVMAARNNHTIAPKSQDKQLQGISLQTVMEKRRLDQALNAKEFAVCAGVSYSMARSWFRLPGFPVFHGVIFWQDFVQWFTSRMAASRGTPARRRRLT